jgi:hypothetical protein
MSPATKQPLEPYAARRRLWLGAAVLIPAAGATLWVVRAVPAPDIFLNPFLWVSLAGVWFGAFCLAYGAEVGALMRETRARPGLRLSGIHIAWASTPFSRSRAGARAQFECFAGDDYPPAFTLHLNLSVTWSFFLVGIECAWDVREDGVLLLGGEGPRFLSGATVESLELPSVETAALRVVLEPGGPRKTLPDWGRPPGDQAARVIEAVRPAQWLLGPEQPYIAFEAMGDRIEKWWPPPLDRLLGLDPGTGLDLARIVRAFDLDAHAHRAGTPPAGPTSSPAP